RLVAHVAGGEAPHDLLDEVEGPGRRGRPAAGVGGRVPLVEVTGGAVGEEDAARHGAAVLRTASVRGVPERQARPPTPLTLRPCRRLSTRRRARACPPRPACPPGTAA